MNRGNNTPECVKKISCFNISIRPFLPRATAARLRRGGREVVVCPPSGRDAYVRIGNESVKADAIQLKRLVLKGAGRSWDSLPT